jgi:hypothetical protein
MKYLIFNIYVIEDWKLEWLFHGNEQQKRDHRLGVMNHL